MSIIFCYLMYKLKNTHIALLVVWFIKILNSPHAIYITIFHTFITVQMKEKMWERCMNVYHQCKEYYECILLKD